METSDLSNRIFARLWREAPEEHKRFKGVAEQDFCDVFSPEMASELQFNFIRTWGSQQRYDWDWRVLVEFEGKLIIDGKKRWCKMVALWSSHGCSCNDIGSAAPNPQFVTMRRPFGSVRDIVYFAESNEFIATEGSRQPSRYNALGWALSTCYDFEIPRGE